MYKLVSFSLLVCLAYSSCSESSIIEVDLAQPETTIILKPKSGLTSSCTIEYIGNTDCTIQIAVESEETIRLNKGSFSLEKDYECYEAGKRITISADNCSQESKMSIKYSFSNSYFGQKK